MLWNELIELGNVTQAIVYGEPVDTVTYRSVFADKQSVRQTEFYEARQLDLKPEVMFVVRSAEFSNDEFVRWNSKEYRIIRTFDKGETIELVVGALNNG